MEAARAALLSTPMSPTRPKLKLDEQSFQDMLGAAFTIQEHNAQRKRALQPPEHVCAQCGALLKDGALLCERCTEEAPRPGEDLQRKWASLWLMSQEQGLWTDRSSAPEPEIKTDAPAETKSGEVPTLHFPDFPQTIELPVPSLPVPSLPVPSQGIASATDLEKEADWPGAALDDLRSATQVPAWKPDVEFPSQEPLEIIEEAPPAWSLRDLRLKLRFHRADLYLVVSIAVATVAMIWVLSATPAPGAQRKPRLRPWEKVLIAMGLAEAPEPPPKRGNPNVQVWVDPKTALYYCVGEELYGKAPGGHATIQRDARLDGFQPAGRAACE